MLGLFIGIIAWATPQIDDMRRDILQYEEKLLQVSSKKERAQIIQVMLGLSKRQRYVSEERLRLLDSEMQSAENKQLAIERKQLALLRALKASFAGLAQNHGVKRFALRRVIQHLFHIREMLRTDSLDIQQIVAQVHEEKEMLHSILHNLGDVHALCASMRGPGFERYRALRRSQYTLEKMLAEFHAHTGEAQVSIAYLKGKLPLPLAGKITAKFGSMRHDAGITYFRKGIDIVPYSTRDVRSIADGSVAYSGQLPYYGQVVIIDHGDRLYSLTAHLVTSHKIHRHQKVRAGDLLGLLEQSQPLYFELRSKNIPIDPLIWLAG